MKRILLVIVLFSVFAGCSSGSVATQVGSAQRTGRYLDNVWERTKRGTADSYDKSKEWVRTTSDRFSRGVSGFGRGWRSDERHPERDVYNRDVDSSYDYPDEQNDDDDYGQGQRKGYSGRGMTLEETAPRVDSGDARY